MLISETTTNQSESMYSIWDSNEIIIIIIKLPNKLSSIHDNVNNQLLKKLNWALSYHIWSIL